MIPTLLTATARLIVHSRGGCLAFEEQTAFLCSLHIHFFFMDLLSMKLVVLQPCLSVSLSSRHGGVVKMVTLAI